MPVHVRPDWCGCDKLGDMWTAGKPSTFREIFPGFLHMTTIPWSRVFHIHGIRLQLFPVIHNLVGPGGIDVKPLP